MKKVALLSLAALVLILPESAAAAPRTFKELADLIVQILDTGTGLLILTGVVIYFWGISTNILKMKDEGGKVFKAYFLWGIIALFVMVSIWGIIELLQNTLFGSDGTDPSVGGASSGLDADVDGGFPVFE